MSTDAQKCLRCHMEWWVHWTMMTAFRHFIWHLRHFWASVLINTWNFEVNSFGPCYTHLIQCVQCIGWWYWPRYPCQMGDARAKICIHYHCVNIRINSLGCNANSFDPWSRHIGLPSDPRIGDFNGWNFCLCLNQHMHYDSSEIRS